MHEVSSLVMKYLEYGGVLVDVRKYLECVGVLVEVKICCYVVVSRVLNRPTVHTEQ